MPRTALTESDIQSFRERAIEASTRLFAERGPEGISMRAIAAELGCSAMTPYRYFQNRDEVIAMIRASCFRRFADRQEATYKLGGGPAAVVVALGRAYLKFALEDPDAYRIMFALKQQPAGHYPELDRQARRGFSFLLSAAEDGVTAGVFEGDALTFAHVNWAAIHGIVSLHLAGKLVLGRTVTQLAQAALSFGES